MLGPGNPARALLAADQAALAVDGVAVGIAGWLAEDAYRVSGLVPAEDPVVRDVAEDEVAPGGEVGGSLGPSASGVQAFHPVIPATTPEPLVEHLELRLERVPHRALTVVVPAQNPAGISSFPHAQTGTKRAPNRALVRIGPLDHGEPPAGWQLRRDRAAGTVGGLPSEVDGGPEVVVGRDRVAGPL